MADSSINNLIHLLASTSKHAYPALLDFINYIDTIKKLPNRVDFDTINEMFRIVLNYTDTDEEIISVYHKWIRFILRFSDDPFTIDVQSVLPERIRYANDDTIRISKVIDDNWKKDIDIPPHIYEEMLTDSGGSPKAELIRFLKDENYEPILDGKAEPELHESLELLFNKYYYDGKTEKALEVLKLMPKNWRRFWNEHLCDPLNEETIDSLLFMLENDKEEIPGRDVLILQLELKALVNGVEGKLGEEGFIDEEIIRQVSLEIEMEYHDLDDNSEEMVDIFTTKLYEKAVFSKAKAIFSSIPEEANNDELISIYIELKKVFEFCEEQGIEKSLPFLDKINKVLFDELKDVASGISVIQKMLKNNSHIKLAQYLEQLSYIIQPDSLEMEALYEMLTRHISTQRFSPKQYSMYNGVLKNSHHPQFKVLGSLLFTFQKDENGADLFAKTLTENMEIFKNNHQLFYTTMEPVFHSRLGLKAVQCFVSRMMSVPMEPHAVNSMTHLLIDYINEQPYLDFKKDFPVSNVSQKNIASMLVILETMVERSMEDLDADMELESRWQAVETCRSFLNSLSGRKVKVSVLGDAVI